MRALISAAIRVAVGMPHRFSVTSRYASLSDSGSTSGVYSSKISRICRDTAR